MNTLTAYVPGKNNYYFDFLPNSPGNKFNFLEDGKLSDEKAYQDRMAFARDEDCSILSIVGYGEPLLWTNMPFVNMINRVNRGLRCPFTNIELKTNGSLFMESFEYLRDTDIKTIVLYLTAFDDFKHYQLMTDGGDGAYKFEIQPLCEKIKEEGYNLRLEVFMSKWLEYFSFDDIIKQCTPLNPDQVTLNKMLMIDGNPDVNNWIKTRGCQQQTIDRIKETLDSMTPIGKTSNNYNIYSVDNISYVLNDGTQKDNHNLHLLPNAKLYRKPDNLGSLIF